MKKLRCWAGLIVLVFLGASSPALFATESTGDILNAIDLAGQSMDVTEMDEILGGLPRACHDPKYDPIENACLNNKGQVYVDGVNDCDIWVETVLKQAGVDISSSWGKASSTSVSGHAKKLSGKLSNKAPEGWSVEFIDGSHVALVRVNEDGSADLFHQGTNRETRTTQKWKGSRGYNYKKASSAYWGDESRKFWDF